MTLIAANAPQNSQTTAAEVLGSTGSQSTPAEAPKTSTPPADDKVAPKFQALIQREKTAVERERAARAREAAAEARAKDIEAREAKVREFETLKQTHPLKALELLGLSYQELTQIALSDGNIPPELHAKRVEEKLDSYVKSQEDRDREASEREKLEEEKRNTSTITKFKGEIGSYLKQNSERYELMAFENPDDQGQDLVYEVIDLHYNQTLEAAKAKALEEDPEADTSEIRGEVLTISQASDKVELKLEEKYQKSKTLKKVAAFLAPRQEKPSVDKPKLPPRQTPQTLTNQLSASPASQRKTPITDDERIAKAIAYARGLRPAA